MYLDAQNLFSDDQTLVAAQGTVVSTNAIDFTAAGVEAGQPLHLLIQITTAVTAAGASTVQFAAYTDSDSAFGTEVMLCDTPAIGKASLVSGYQAALSFIPRHTDQYVRLKYVIAGADIDLTGAVTAGIIIDNQQGADVN